MKSKEQVKEKIKTKFIENKNMRILLFTLILLSEVFALINRNFISTYNLVSICQSAAPYAVLSLGAIFPIALGYTDLSTGAVCIGSAVVAGKLYEMGMPFPAVIPVMILFGTLMGFLNGMLISRLKLPPFIVTLGTMMFVRGATALFAGEPNVLFPTGIWYNNVFSYVRGIPTGSLWVILAALWTSWFFRRGVTGRHMLAAGSSEKAAVIAGIDTAKLKVIAFTISGMMAGFAAILWSASFATVSAASGNGMELDAIAGAYIGGSAAAGGSVNAAGAVIGSLLLVIIRNGLNFVLAKLNLSLNATYVTYVITGVIVVLAVFLDKAKEQHGRKKADEEGSKVQKYLMPAIAFVLAVIMIITNTVIYVDQKEKENKTLAVLLKGENSNFWDSVRAGAEASAAEKGYRLLIRGSETEEASQLPVQRDLMRVMLSENPAGMAVATIADGFTDLLQEAYDRNVSVIEYDSGLFGNDAEEIAASGKNPLCGFVQGDSYGNAALLAEAVFKELKNKISFSKTFRVGVIQHDNSVTAKTRTDGFLERFMELAEADPATAGKCEAFVEVKSQDGPSPYKDGLEALFEKNVSLVYMTAEPVINQVYDAAAASGDKYDEIWFAGYDSGEKARKWLYSDSKAGFLCGVSQNPYALGKLTVDTLVDIVENGGKEAYTKVPGIVYNRENCEELLEKMMVN